MMSYNKIILFVMTLPLFTASIAAGGLQTAYGGFFGDCEVASDCPSVNECTSWVCENPNTVNSECIAITDDSICDDGDMCTFNECNKFTGCFIDGVKTCNPVFCGENECNPSTGLCEVTPDDFDCPSGNECTNVFCDDSGSCIVTTDDDFCNLGDQCTFNECDESLGCLLVSEIVCDGVQCGENECNPSTGLCEVAPEDVDCDIFEQCIAGFCDINGGCFGNPDPFNGLDCDDGIGLCFDGECIPKDADIHVLKFNDLNADGVQDDDEDGIPGWEITLACENDTFLTEETDDDGMVRFEEILAPTDCIVSEEARPEWTATTSTSVNFELNPGDERMVTFGNIRALETEKFYTETEIDIEAGDFGVKLPFTDDGTQTVQAVIHPKTGKITSYNPGQYYAVTKVTAFVDLATVSIFEDDILCTGGDKPISIWNPNKFPGGAYVAMMCGEETVDLTRELAKSGALFRNSAGVLQATVEDVKAGCMVFLGVKYSPGLKGEAIGGLEREDLFCDNWEIVCANLTHEDNGNTDNADASTDNNSVACIADVIDSAHRVLEVLKCGENEEEDTLGECVCKPGFVENPNGICVAAEF